MEATARRKLDWEMQVPREGGILFCIMQQKSLPFTWEACFLSIPSPFPSSPPDLPQHVPRYGTRAELLQGLCYILTTVITNPVQQCLHGQPKGIWEILLTDQCSLSGSFSFPLASGEESYIGKYRKNQLKQELWLRDMSLQRALFQIVPDPLNCTYLAEITVPLVASN